MIVCHCRAVNDRAIRKVVREGACSFRQVALASQAGRTCGGCRPAVLEVMDEELRDRDTAASASGAIAAS